MFMWLRSQMNNWIFFSVASKNSFQKPIWTLVLIPEACLLIERDVLSIPYPEAVVCNPQHNHLPSFKRRAGSTDDSKVLTTKQKVHKHSTTTTSSSTHDECAMNYGGTVSPNQNEKIWEASICPWKWSQRHDSQRWSVDWQAHYDGTVPFKDTVPRNWWLVISNTRSNWTVSTNS